MINFDEISGWYAELDHPDIDTAPAQRERDVAIIESPDYCTGRPTRRITPPAPVGPPPF